MQHVDVGEQAAGLEVAGPGLLDRPTGEVPGPLASNAGAPFEMVGCASRVR
jgi:hypothetical protein